MRFKVLLCVLTAAISFGGCKKAPAQAAGAGTPAGGTQAAATPGPAGSGTPPAQAAPPKPVPAQLPEVLAKVNGEAVKKEDFDRMVHTIEQRAGGPIPPERRDEILRGALDQLIVYTLLTQESKTRGVKVEDAEIEQKMGQLKQQFPTQEAFEKALKDRGMSLDR